jgi:hypothetical protein
MQLSVDYRLCTAAALDMGATAPVNAPRDLRDYLIAAGIWGASPESPVFFYRNRDGSLAPRQSRFTLLKQLRSLILAPSGVPSPHTFTLRSLRPGGATDLAAAGVPESIIRKIGKWSSEHGLVPYNRVDHHLLQGLSSHRPSLLALQ